MCPTTTLVFDFVMGLPEVRGSIVWPIQYSSILEVPSFQTERSTVVLQALDALCGFNSIGSLSELNKTRHSNGKRPFKRRVSS